MLLVGPHADVIRVGVAAAEYEVAEGTPMAGFIARVQSSIGTHDPVSVRVLVLDSACAVVAVDACALHEDTCASIRQDGLELGLDEVVVGATHTHSGPSVACGRLGPHDHDAHTAIIEAARRALREALANGAPCNVEFVEEHGLGIAHDRRRDRAMDIPVRALKFLDRFGTVAATWVNFACHPVVLDASNLLISADYPSAVRTRMEQRHPGSTCVFTTGAAGEINTGHRAADSLTLSSDSRRTFERAEAIGVALADAADRPGAPVPASTATLVSEPVTLRYAAAGGKPPDGPSWTGRISVLELGPLLIIFLPGEPFHEWAEPLLRSACGDRGFVVAYTDGVPGYLPTPAAYGQGGYEVDEAHRFYGAPGPFTADCSLVLTAAVERACARLSPPRAPRDAEVP